MYWPASLTGVAAALVSLGADSDVISGLAGAVVLPETSAARACGVSAVVAGAAVAEADVVPEACVVGEAEAGVVAEAGVAAEDSSPIAARIASSHAWAASVVGAAWVAALVAGAVAAAI